MQKAKKLTSSWFVTSTERSRMIARRSEVLSVAALCSALDPAALPGQRGQCVRWRASIYLKHLSRQRSPQEQQRLFPSLLLEQHDRGGLLDHQRPLCHQQVHDDCAGRNLSAVHSRARRHHPPFCRAPRPKLSQQVRSQWVAACMLRSLAGPCLVSHLLQHLGPKPS